MNKSLVLIVVLVVLFATVIEAKRTSVDKLRIGVKFRPEVCERKSKNGDRIKVHYTGTLLKDGSKFDSSVDRGEPFTFTLGVGQVIKGWDIGMRGLCVGEKRILQIPGDMAYGERGSPPKIGPNDSLKFEVEMIGFEN